MVNNFLTMKITMDLNPATGEAAVASVSSVLRTHVSSTSQVALSWERQSTRCFDDIAWPQSVMHTSWMFQCVAVTLNWIF